MRIGGKPWGGVLRVRRTSPKSPKRASIWGAVQCRLLWYYCGAPQRFHGRFDTINLVIWRLVKGTVRVKFADFQVEAPKGAWMVMIRGMRTQEFSSDAYIESIHLHLDAGSAEWTGPPAAMLPRNQELRHAAAAVGEVVRGRKAGGCKPGAEIFQVSSFTEQALVQEKIWRFCGRLIPLLREAGIDLCEPDIADLRVARSLAIIEALPLALPWDRNSIARAVGISASQLDRAWRAARNQTPCQYWDLRRIRFAREKLENTRWSIKEVASELGFTHLAQFSNWFRCRQSVSPRAYRQRVAR